jgi:hypothetical protein
MFAVEEFDDAKGAMPSGLHLSQMAECVVKLRGAYVEKQFIRSVLYIARVRA